ncbi:uncharacterized protein LOC131636700 [Vicia villosa]|uniref:uncharacterized protein LOC131636700 n=1 Tax=Vicia villosa TaxID=3911 RepID=UPI00273B08BC|nr:uncharacterized protein LOC131636700 [Vicia villosa]
MEWQRSGRKLFRGLTPKWDCFPYGGRQSNPGEKLSSFYFSAFPDRCKAIGMFKLFGCVGEVVEVVIPPRRNKFGRRFGFARFKEVMDERLVAVRLDNILIDGVKIHVNQPRFQRNGRKESFVVEQKQVKGTEKVFPGFTNRWVEKAKTFADVVQGGSKKDGPETKEAFFEFTASEELKRRWKKAYVGEVLFPGESYNIQTHLEIEGFFSIKVFPLGANLCILEEMEEGLIKELIEEGKWWWQQWFKNIKPWQEKDIDEARVVWIRVYGVPCHAWSNDFFVSLANRLGVFICLDENTMTGCNMDIARLMVRVDSRFILPETLKVVIDDVPFTLNLREDSFGPLRINAQKVADQVLGSSSSSSYAGSMNDEVREDGDVNSEVFLESKVGSEDSIGVEVEDLKQMEEAAAANRVAARVVSELSESSDSFLGDEPNEG